MEFEIIFYETADGKCPVTDFTDGIFELRCSIGYDRTLYFFCVGKKIILTNGFKKKTQRPPRSEIELAKTRREEAQGNEILFAQTQA